MDKDKSEDIVINVKTKKIKEWFAKPENLLIVFIIIGAFALRWYYLDMSAGQALWWDEAEYMSAAKHWAFNVPYDLNPQRPPLFQLAAALLLMLGFNEFILKLLIIVIPSTILIYLTYFLGKELFDKKIGLFAALASAGMWSYLFWSARFQPDFLSMCFQLLSLVYFWKLFKEPSRKSAIFAGAFAALGFYFKISALLVPASIFVFVLFKDRLAFLKNKNYWIAFFSFVITMIPFMLWQYSLFGNPLAFAPSYGLEGGSAARPLGWGAVEFFYSFPGGLLSLFFVAGLALILFKIIVSFDLMLKEEKRRLNPELFSLIVLIVVTSFYVFYIQGVIEDRWMFLAAPFIFIFAGYGALEIISKLGVKSNSAKAFIILIILAIFFYYQLSHTNALIENKMPSYKEVKEAALWIKDNSDKSDSIVSASYTQMTTYAERKVYPYMPRFPNAPAFTEFLKQEKPKYMTLSIFEGHPDYAFQRQQNAQGFTLFLMPYLNSSIVINPQGQILSLDLKQNIEKEGINFTFVYPQNQLNGFFVYEMNYEE